MYLKMGTFARQKTKRECKVFVLTLSEELNFAKFRIDTDNNLV